MHCATQALLAVCIHKESFSLQAIVASTGQALAQSLSSLPASMSTQLSCRLGSMGGMHKTRHTCRCWCWSGGLGLLACDAHKGQNHCASGTSSKGGVAQ